MNKKNIEQGNLAGFYEWYIINNIIMIDFDNDTAIIKVDVTSLLPEVEGKAILGFEQEVNGACLRSMMCGSNFDSSKLPRVQQRVVAMLKKYIKLYFINKMTMYYG